jgi:hypothetical protein
VGTKSKFYFNVYFKKLPLQVIQQSGRGDDSVEKTDAGAENAGNKLLSSTALDEVGEGVVRYVCFRYLSIHRMVAEHVD